MELHPNSCQNNKEILLKNKTTKRFDKSRGGVVIPSPLAQINKVSPGTPLVHISIHMPVRNREKPTHERQNQKEDIGSLIRNRFFLFIQQCRSGGEEE
jgi:hypothetical protein